MSFFGSYFLICLYATELQCGASKCMAKTLTKHELVARLRSTNTQVEVQPMESLSIAPVSGFTVNKLMIVLVQ